MRNREAARYARWSAIAAAIIAVIVAGVYAQRILRESRAIHEAPKPVPVTVQQQSAQFSFSKVEQNRTIFTIRASRATQYKDQDRALLEDVWITIYGRDGGRNDNIHTHECDYQPQTGAVLCQGEVQIDLQSAAAGGAKSGQPLPDSLEIKTSNLSFNRNTGEASTPAAVEFRFPAGQGRGVGATYSSHEEIVRVQRNVSFDISASERTGGLPVNVTGSSLEVRRGERTVSLGGPAVVRAGARQLSAEKISIDLDDNFHARRMIAEGHPQVAADEAHGKVVITADRFEALLNAEGWIDRIVADGNIAGSQETLAGANHFSAGHVEFAMIPARNLIDEMTATGGVTGDVHQGTDTHSLKTDALRIKFSVPEAPAHSAGKLANTSMESQRIESAETLSPATIESRTAKDTTMIRAKKFTAEIGAGGRLEKLLGHSGVEITRQSGGGAPQVISSAEMAATFDAQGQWDTLFETGGVHFQQADRQATATRANIVRASDTIHLEGSPVLSDSMSRTTAADVTINQSSGDLHASGSVVSTYVAAAQGSVGLGDGVAHISADTLSGSVNKGEAIYTGHARLWQGDSVLESDEIELWRDEKKLRANGHVVAVFPQASGPLTPLPGAGAKPTSSSGPTLWKVMAPVLTYWSDLGKAHLEGGVTASSDQGSMASRTLDAFLDQAAVPTGGGGATQATGARQLSRVLGQGNVVVSQGDRRGTSEQAEYTAADGKFILSGGQPTIVNASSDTTTGHSLTFFVANDTILVDSQEGSRTVTKHRVEK